MPHYYFHLHNDVDVLDEEGFDLPDVEAARAAAVKSARELMGAQIGDEGRLTLSDWIEVQDESGARILTIRFGDIVEIRP